MSGFEDWAADPLSVPAQTPVGVAAPVPFWDTVGLNASAQARVDEDGRREERTRAALWARHREIERRTGTKLPLSHSLTGEPTAERDPVKRMLDALVPVDRLNAAILGQPGAARDDDYETQIEAMRAKDPARFAGIRTRSELTADLDAEFRAIEGRAAEASQGPKGMAAAFLGRAIGSMTNPGNAGVAIATGGLGAGRPLLTRMLMQGVTGAAVEGVAAGGKAQDAATFGGPAYGAGEALADVGFAGAGAAGFEAIGAGVKAGLKPLILRSVGGLEGAPKRAAELLDRADLDDLAIGARSGEEHAEVTAALDAGRLPDLSPDRDLTEFPAEPGALQATEYRGRRIWGGSFDPRQLEADPVRFQYKADGDDAGVTARLRGVEAWDATASGKVIVWEDRAGTRFVADGHQRRGLALRMDEAGWDARLDGYLLREADGWSAKDARIVAALKNIREGSGSPLDAAKLLREAPEATNDRSLPVSGEFMGQARGLAQLSEPAFKAAVNKVISERHAAEIGLMAGHRADLHEDMVRLLKEAEPANADEARALIVEALSDDWIKTEGDQADLFGYDPSTSAMIARAKVKAQVMRSLSRDTKVFNALIRNADAIEAGGNALARDANEARLALDRAAQELIGKLALRAGPVGEAMQAAVARVHAGEPVGLAAKDVLARVREAIARGEQLELDRAAAIDPSAPGPKAGELLADFDDPAGKGAEAQSLFAPEDAMLDGPEAARAQMAAEIDQVLAAAAGPGHAPQKAVLGEASDWLTAEAKAAGLDIEGYRHVIDGSAVRHVTQRHADPAAEAARGQIPVTEADLKALPDLLAAPDLVGLGLKGRRGQDVIVLAKRQADGSTLVLEEARKGKRELALVTMWKVPAAIDANRLASSVDLNARNDGGTMKIVAPPKDASAVALEPPAGLFDDLAEDGRHAQALDLLKRCAPEE